MYTEDERKLKELIEQEIKSSERFYRILKYAIILTAIASIASGVLGYN